MYGVLFDFPTATSMISNIGEYSNPWFSELWDYAYPVIGIALVIGLIVVIFKVVASVRHT